MQPKDQDRIAMHRGLRSILIEASDDELREAFAGTGEDLDAFAARGRAAADRAIAEATGAAGVEDLHRGLGALIQMLRRDKRLSIEELATGARVDAAELQKIERDRHLTPAHGPSTNSSSTSSSVRGAWSRCPVRFTSTTTFARKRYALPQVPRTYPRTHEEGAHTSQSLREIPNQAY